MASIRPSEPLRLDPQERRRCRRSAPQQHLDVFANPSPGTRLRHRVRDPRVHLQLPAHRPAGLRPVHDRDGRRRPVHRAEEPEALLLELSRRRRVPRGGDQPILDDIVAASKPRFVRIRGALERARRHLHQRGRRAPRPRAGSRPSRSRCRRCRSTARRPETGAAARSISGAPLRSPAGSSSSARRPTCS